MRTTCPTNLTLLDMMTMIIFCDEQELRNTSLRSVLQLPVTSHLLGPNAVISTLISEIIYALPLQRQTKFRTHITQKIELDLFIF
jgi:hypothetical protein